MLAYIRFPFQIAFREQRDRGPCLFRRTLPGHVSTSVYLSFHS